MGLRQNLWVRVVRKEEKNSGLKAVFSCLGDQSPKPPGVFRIGPKACLGRRVGRPQAAHPTRFRTWTALGLLPSIALSSGQVVEV